MADLPDGTAEMVARALAEDLGPGDLTSEATVPPDARATGRIVLKEPGVIYGLEVAREVFRQAGAEEFEVGDAQRVLDGDLDPFIREYLNRTA